VSFVYLAVLFFLTVALAAWLLTMLVHGYFMFRNRVPYVLAPVGVLGEIVSALELPKQGTMVDLGCGDGRVLEAVQRAAPGMKLVGVDNNPLPLVLARMKLGATAKLKRRDILQTDLTGVTRVFCYLGPELMAQLEKKFERELTAEARVVSMQFPIPNRKPVKEVELAHGKAHAARLYVYKY
jgi:SAM-dependent methyltransferase